LRGLLAARVYGASVGLPGVGLRGLVALAVRRSKASTHPEGEQASSTHVEGEAVEHARRGRGSRAAYPDATNPPGAVDLDRD